MILFLVPEKSPLSPTSIKEHSNNPATPKKNILRVRGADELFPTPATGPSKHALNKPTNNTKPAPVPKPAPRAEPSTVERSVPATEIVRKPESQILPDVRRLKRGPPSANIEPAKRPRTETATKTENKVIVGKEKNRSDGVYMPESLLECLVSVKEVNLITSNFCILSFARCSVFCILYHVSCILSPEFCRFNTMHDVFGILYSFQCILLCTCIIFPVICALTFSAFCISNYVCMMCFLCDLYPVLYPVFYVNYHVSVFPYSVCNVLSYIL